MRIFSQSGRSERRIPCTVPMWLTSLESGGILERVTTENVSSLGARVLATKSWPATESVLVSFPPGFSTGARIVYCHRLPSENFALGIRLQNPPSDWMKTLEETVALVHRRAVLQLA
jgi:hypothetical protein